MKSLPTTSMSVADGMSVTRDAPESAPDQTNTFPSTVSTDDGWYCSSVVLHGGSSCLRSRRMGA